MWLQTLYLWCLFLSFRMLGPLAEVCAEVLLCYCPVEDIAAVLRTVAGKQPCGLIIHIILYDSTYLCLRAAFFKELHFLFFPFFFLGGGEGGEFHLFLSISTLSSHFHWRIANLSHH